MHSELVARSNGARRVTTKQEDPKTGEEVERTRLAFFPCSVFDVSQTDVVDPEKAVVSPLDKPQVDDAGVFEAAKAFMESSGWTVTIADAYGAGGYADRDTKSIVISPHKVAAQAQTRTMLHEAAHGLMHADPEGAKLSVHKKEIEAESVAYMVSHVFGMDTRVGSMGYIDSWAGGDPKLIKASADRVLAASRTLIEGIEKHLPPASPTVADTHGVRLLAGVERTPTLTPPAQPQADTLRRRVPPAQAHARTM